MSSDSENSSDEDFEAHSHLFKSSLDVGSHFIDIVPDNELVFVNHQGTLFTQLTIKNSTNKAHVAYFVTLLSELIKFRFSHQHHSPLLLCPSKDSYHHPSNKLSISDGKITQ